MKDYKQIMTIALPAMAENFLQMLMGLVDGYLVAGLGLVAISGVSIAGNIITVYQAIFIALAAAVSSLVAKSLGEGNQEKLSKYATESLKVTLLLSVFLGGLSILSGDSLIAFLGTEEAVAQTGGLYLSLVGGSIFLLGLMTTLGALIRTTKNPKIPMYISLLANFLNALFSSLAIFLLDWGIMGVALGTIISRLIGVFLLWQQVDVPFARWKWGFDRELVQLSLPAAGERLMMRAGDLVIIMLVTRFGTEAVAGNAIGENLTQFNYMPAFGVATATVILVGHSLGQRNIQQIRETTRLTYFLSLALMLPVALGIFLLGRPLTELFTANPAALEASLWVVLFSLLGVPMTAGTVIYTAVWQGLGNARLPFYATSIGMWVIRIGAGYFLGMVCQLGLPGVWAGTLLDNGFRWTFLAYLYHKKIPKEV